MPTNGTKRPAEIVLGAETRKLRRDLAAAKGEIRGFGKDAASSIRSSLGTAFAGALSLASLGGAVSVVKDVVANERALTRLGIQADVSTERVRALSSNIFQISDSTGQATSELIAGASQIVTLTGEMKLAEQSVSALGVAATATGSDLRDLAGVSAALGTSLNIKGRTAMSLALDALAIQGKKGKIELKDLASLLPTASAQFARFGEKGMDAVATLGAGLQIVARATGTPAEAATAFNALGRAYESHAKRLKKYAGIDVKRKDGSTRDFFEITDELRRAKLRKGATMFDVLGTDEAVKGFEALRTHWTDFEGLIADGLDGGGTIAADFKRYIESPAGRMERAWTRASNALQRAITPERVELLARATEKFAQAIGFAVDHATELVALVGSIKIAQLALATSRWSTALAGVAGQAGPLNTRLGSAAGSLQGMTAGSATLVSRMGQVAGAAGGIASAFTASFTATSALLDALGVFEDKYKTVATADDPNRKAADTALMQQQAEDEVHVRQKRLSGYRQTRGQFGRFYRQDGRTLDLDAMIQQAEAELRRAEGEVASRRATHLATTFMERDVARGTDAAPAVLDALQQQQLLKQDSPTPLRPSGVLALPDTEVLQEYAPELQALAGDKLDRVIGLLEQSLREQERLRAINERVAQKAGGRTSSPPPPIRAPLTGTLPR
jgi:hypothetical protein